VKPSLVEERIRRFRRSWHAGDLWPGVSEQQFLAATAGIVRATTAMAEWTAGPPDRPVVIPGDTDARTLGIAAHVTGMGPLLGYWIERGYLEAPADVAGLLADHLDHGRRRAARLERELERVVGALGNAGVAATVLKGMHTARTYFPEAGVRPMADLDLLIDEASLPAARRGLTSIGLGQTSSVRGRSTWSAHGPRVPQSLEMAHADDPWDVDLHLTLDRRFSEVMPARLGPVRRDDLAPFPVGGSHTTCLAQPLLTALLALHGSDHFEMAGLMRPWELGLVIRRDSANGTLEWDALAGRLRATGALRFVYPAFELTEKLVPGTVDPAFRAAVRAAAPHPVRRVVDRTEPARATRMYDRSVDLRLMWLDGWRSRLRWVAWRVWPRIGDAPAPPTEAARLTAQRILRVVTGRMRWGG
jgi:hypothetical protein